MKTDRAFSRLLTASTLALAMALSGPAFAQSGAQTTAETPKPTADDDARGDIVVTALKRESSVQTTPLAITAVSARSLSRMGIVDSNGLAKASPGLVIREGSLSGSRITIRNINAAGEATVGLYYDETPLMGSSGVNSDAGGTTPNISMFDVERVEVLRGPQGTLYGSSSMAGTVRLILAKPRLDHVEGTVAGQITAVDGGDPGFRTQGVVNLPIIKDKLAVRVMGFHSRTGGYIDNVTLGRKNINSQTSDGGRLTVRYAPTDRLTLDGLASVQTLNGSLNDYFLAQGTYKTNYEALQPLRDQLQLYSGTLNWDAGFAKLTVVGTHSYRNFNYSYDISAYFRTFGTLYPAGSATYNAFMASAPSVANSPQITKTDSVEARLAGGGKSALQWTLGWFYANRNGDFASNIARVAADGGPLPLTTANLEGQRVITDHLKQQAVFAEATYALTSRLSVTGGLRYYHYDRRVTGAVPVPNALVGFTAGTPTDQSSGESGWLYKMNASYKVAPHVMVYATAASGERPGGVNQTVGLPANLQTYASDSLWNYELGTKSELLGGLILLNADVFRIDWSNMQTSGTLPNTNFGFIANAGKARVRGIEVESTITPYKGLQFQLSTSYMVAKLLQDQSNQSLLAAGLAGDNISNVPRVTGMASAQYGWDLGGTMKALLRADTSVSGATWTQFRHTSVYQNYLPANTLVSLRAGISARDDNWSLSLFVNNLLNDQTVVNKLSANIYGGLNNVRAISNAPRTFGLDLTKHF